MRKTLVLFAVLAMMAAPALAVQNRHLVENDRTPPVSTTVDGDHCSDPNAFIGGGNTVVVDTLTVSGTGETVSGLGVGLQVVHVWIGDLIATLDNGTDSATIMDQPGFPADPTWGCSADDVDATISDAGSPPVEDVCNWPGPPGIGGNPGSAPDALAVFNGASLDGDWTMTLTDAYEPFSDGTFERWCLTNNFDAPGEGEGTPQTPATSTWGVIAMIVLFLGVSLFFLRRRATA